MATTRLFLRIWSERAVSRSLRFSLIPNAGTRSTPSLICEPLSRSGASITVVLPLRLDHMGGEGKGRGYCPPARRHLNAIGRIESAPRRACLLYTSDAADDLTRVDLGGRRIIKK